MARASKDQRCAVASADALAQIRALLVFILQTVIGIQELRASGAMVEAPKYFAY